MPAKKLSPGEEQWRHRCDVAYRQSQELETRIPIDVHAKRI